MACPHRRPEKGGHVSVSDRKSATDRKDLQLNKNVFKLHVCKLYIKNDNTLPFLNDTLTSLICDACGKVLTISMFLLYMSLAPATAVRLLASAVA